MLEQCGQTKAALKSPAGCERVGKYVSFIYNIALYSFGLLVCLSVLRCIRRCPFGYFKVSAQAKIVLKTIHDTLPQFDCFSSEI